MADLKNLNLNPEALKKLQSGLARKKTKHKKGFGFAVFLLVFLLLIAIGLTCTWFILGKDDTFELNGEEHITLSLSQASRYEDEGVTVISFGQDVSDIAILETDLLVSSEGYLYAQNVGIYYIKYIPKDFKYGTILRQSLIRYINVIADEGSESSPENPSNNPFNHDKNLTVQTSNVSIHFLELGNVYTGDCTYIKTPTADILIDCGSKSSSIPTITSYLNQYVTDGKLEYVIITHAHEDHYAGFATYASTKSIFDLYECETIITFSQIESGKANKTMYKNFVRELNAEIANGAKHYTALECVKNQNGAKATFDLGNNVSINILNSYFYDHKPALASEDNENLYSVCTLIKDGDKNFIFTGDLEEIGEQYLIELNDLPECDLYKAGHHGSKTSSSSAFMKVIKPKTVCVCCCAGSSQYTDNIPNQFPTQIFINNVAPYTTEIYVTTLCVDYSQKTFTSFNGNIVYMSSSTGYNVVCSNNNTILKESNWFKNNRTWPSSS